MSIDGPFGDAAAVSANSDRELLRKCEGGTFGPREEVAHLGRADQRVGVLEGQVRAEQCVQREHTIDVEMIVHDELGLDVIGIGDVSQADLGGAVGLVARIRMVRYPMAELDVAVTANAARIRAVGEDDTVPQTGADARSRNDVLNRSVTAAVMR